MNDKALIKKYTSKNVLYDYDKSNTSDDRIHELIGEICTLALLKKEGIYDGQSTYHLSRPESDIIIDHLAERFIHFATLHLESKTRRRKIFPEEAKPTLTEARAEAERIFLALKTVGFTTYVTDAEWKKAVLSSFDDSKKGFKYIKREYLEDKILYELRDGKEKHDFIGKLLQMVIREKGYKKYGVQFLYKMNLE
jgi:hypothetical protein